jgi:hypothetical protein
MHELFHFLQFSTMGFMHDWAAELLDYARRIAKPLVGDVRLRDFSGIKQLIEKGPALLKPSEKEALETLFGKLDLPGQSGLTTRAIFESHAYFFERRTNYNFRQPSDWTPFLKTAPSAIYRIAFDFLAFAAGYPSAYEWFSSIASVSLCSPNPTATFEILSLALATNEKIKEMKGEPENARQIIEFLQSQIPEVSLSFPLRGTGKQHVMFSETARTLRKAAEANLFDQDRLFVCPHLEIPSLLQNSNVLVHVPMIFKPAPRSKIAIQMPSKYDLASGLFLFTIGAIGQQLTREIAGASREEGKKSLDRLSWLVRDHVPCLFELAIEDLKSGNPARMIMIFDPKDDMANLKSKWWGNVVLLLPKEIDPSQDALLSSIPEGVRLLRAIHKELPMALLYLSYPHGVYEWFASISPEEALVDGQIDYAHPRVLELIEEAEEAINLCGESINQNPWLAVQRLFGPIHQAFNNA